MKKLIIITLILSSQWAYAQTVLRVVGDHVLLNEAQNLQIEQTIKLYDLFGEMTGVVKVVKMRDDRAACEIITGEINVGDMIAAPTNRPVFKYRREPYLAAVSSMVWPGLGHFYNQNYSKGVGFFLARVASCCLLFTKNQKIETRFISYVAAFFLALVDFSMAFSDAEKINQNLIQEGVNLTFYF
jgi:hypothetical protein